MKTPYSGNAQAIAATEEDTEKTLMQFWKDYSICGCIKDHAWAWGDVTKKCMDGIWKKTLKRFVHDFKRNFQGWGCKSQLSCGWDGKQLKMGVDQDDTEQLLEVGPEELTNEEFLELEPEHTAEEEAREKETAEEKEEPQENSQCRI